MICSERKKQPLKRLVGKGEGRGGPGGELLVSSGKKKMCCFSCEKSVLLILRQKKGGRRKHLNRERGILREGEIQRGLEEKQ